MLRLLHLLAPAGLLPLLAPAAPCAPAAPAQVFVDAAARVPAGAPGNDDVSRDVDLADVDLDGDWDAAFASGQGGLMGLVQNRLWINQGGDQGGLQGFFEDETAARLPGTADRSRDVEFADIDGDGDPDLYVANTSVFLSPQASRFLVNQGTGSGFFSDETATRWLDVGGPGSSVSSGQVLAGGGFETWSADADFADLDQDGDLDLVHSSYGGPPTLLLGYKPHRIFLNDGDGRFREFNPAGTTLVDSTIPPNTSGIWCEGTQQTSTFDTTGTRCDVATYCLEVNVGDLDGDLDLDLLFGDVDVEPRVFLSRLEGSPRLAGTPDGSLAFRDMTAALLPLDDVLGGPHIGQELGDLDGDGDLDLVGVGWRRFGPFFDEGVYRGVGDGSFEFVQELPGSDADDEAAEVFDFDGDGHLDVYVTSFDGSARLYAGDGSADGFTLVAGALPGAVLARAGDAEPADLDGDGDLDLLVASESPRRNLLLDNVGGGADVTPPWLAHLEDLPDRAPGPEPTPVRVHVYDNAPDTRVRSYKAWVEVRVEGAARPDVPLVPLGGQLFRGLLPGSPVGLVEYRAVAEDPAGNRGESPWLRFHQDDCGTLRYCPALPTSLGEVARIDWTGSCVVAANDFTLEAGPVPQQPGIFFYSAAWTAGGQGIPFGAGVRCVGAPGSIVSRLDVTTPVGGVLRSTVDLTAPPTQQGLITPGTTWYFQAWFRDPLGGGLFNLSDAIAVTFQ